MIPSEIDNLSISPELNLRMRLFSRAFVPVRGDPLEVEVDHGPEDVSDPRAIVLFRLEQPFGVFDEVGGTERRAI